MRYDRDEILARVDLEALADGLLGTRHPRTRSWPCPNSDHAQTGRTPPLTIFIGHRGAQLWHCHGCGAGGTAIDLVLATGYARDVREAFEWLGHHAHVSRTVEFRPRRRPASVPREVDAATRALLNQYAAGCAAHLHSSGGRQVLRWLTDVRAIPLPVLAAAGVGADPGRRRLARPDGVPSVYPAAVFTVRDGDDVVYTQSRHLEPPAGWPKWRNISSKVAPNPRMAIYAPPGMRPRGPVVVTEGVLDALSAVTAGTRAVALLGVDAFSSAVADRLTRLSEHFVIATDNDAAGRLARDRLNAMLEERGSSTSTLAIPARHNDLNDWHVACRQDWSETFRVGIRLAGLRSGQGVTPPSVA